MQSLLEKFNSDIGESFNDYEIVLQGERIEVTSVKSILTLVKSIRNTLRILDEEREKNIPKETVLSEMQPSEERIRKAAREAAEDQNKMVEEARKIANNE